MKYCFASLEVDVLTALKERFEKETQVKSFDNPAIEMWVSDSGDVYLRGKLNVIVSNPNGFSDDDVDYIESDKARGNQFEQALLQGKPYITTYELLKRIPELGIDSVKVFELAKLAVNKLTQKWFESNNEDYKNTTIIYNDYEIGGCRTEPGCAHFNTKLYYKFDITEDAEPNYYDDFECDFFSWINPQNDTLIEETKIGDYLLTIYFLKADIWMDNDSTDDDYYDGDFDEPPTPDFGMDDWYPNDEW